MARAALNLFLSSTCYDLVDLRHELRQHLEQRGFMVRLSEDPSSAFFVDPTADSIASCLKNVEESEVIVCIIDRLYGPELPSQYGGLSATHCEVKHARKHKKPIFTFIRDQAFLEYQQLRGDSSAKVHWVEKDRPDRRPKWVEFVKELIELPRSGQWSNFFDQFRSVVDLKSKIENRLVKLFPNQFDLPALLPQRLVRLSFISTIPGPFGESELRGHFQNSGAYPAYDLRFGWRHAQKDVPLGRRGALAPNEALAHDKHANFEIPIPVNKDGQYRAVFCEYENAFGDHYRVEIPYEVEPEEYEIPEVILENSFRRQKPGTGRRDVLVPGKEKLFVLLGEKAAHEWLWVNRGPENPIPLPDPF